MSDNARKNNNSNNERAEKIDDKRGRRDNTDDKSLPLKDQHRKRDSSDASSFSSTTMRAGDKAIKTASTDEAKPAPVGDKSSKGETRTGANVTARSSSSSPIFDDPTKFWAAWSERRQHYDCIEGNADGNNKKGCQCFEGLGSVM